MKVLFLSVLLFFFYSFHACANQKEIKEVTEIINKVIGVCQEQGMLACEKNFSGGDVLFKYIRGFEEAKQYDQAYLDFLKARYPEEVEFDLYVFRASLNIDLNITFTPEQFVSKIENASVAPQGYLIKMNSGDNVSLINQNNTWVLEIPPNQLGQMETLERYYYAAQMKKYILTYRTMEADLAGLSKAQLQKNVSNDLAPFIVALFGKDKFPNIVNYLVKDIGSVISLYKNFDDIKSMEEYIKKTYKLK